MRKFLLGFVVGIVTLPAGAFAAAWLGWLPTNANATTNRPPLKALITTVTATIPGVPSGAARDTWSAADTVSPCQVGSSASAVAGR